ncbi:gap junction delta-4 protein [Salarias fasciatus]|uniref:gap junction delta-4 protein n=1 Tax=Salarias fasciatus TaxID=181472 RepID=UPI001176B61E|nr:gap junction delta-4 protein [Salarias fasciatus]
MAGSSAFDVLFIAVNHSITLMGKVWLIVMVLLRLLVLVFAGYPLYQDEQERFVCNTIQPGCANVCYDLFAPVSLFRFWLVQLLTLCLPSVLFIVYVVHKVSGALTVDLSSAASSKTFRLLKIRPEPPGGASVSKAPPLAGCFTGAYIVQLVFRTLLEAGFGAAHYYLFGFYIPRRFLCQNPPCTTQVDCYISRPTEKTVMLSFMLGAASLSLLLNMLDFIWAIKRSVRQKSRRKMMMEKLFVEEERCFLTARQTSTGTEPAPQRDLEAAPGPVESFRKRQGSRGSRAGGMLDFGPELPALEHCSLPRALRNPDSNSNGNNGYFSQEERDGSEVALCPQDPTGTPRSIRVSKRSKLKPPPPPRRTLALPSGDVSATTAVCTRRLGQYTLVGLGSGAEVQTAEDGLEKRSEWV